MVICRGKCHLLKGSETRRKGGGKRMAIMWPWSYFEPSCTADTRTIQSQWQHSLSTEQTARLLINACAAHTQHQLLQGPEHASDSSKSFLRHFSKGTKLILSVYHFLIYCPPKIKYKLLKRQRIIIWHLICFLYLGSCYSMLNKTDL